MYDDGGLSGGTIERPALQRLLSHIEADKVQIIVVYKVDRLTRSLADFAKIVDVLDTHDASFVSVTQQFNTTTSMGRLTLNMPLSFAQFEREIAGERIRDKIAASKAKGMWMGGNVPLGYDVRERKLVVNEAEASTVRMIFQRYAELGSVSLLRAELDRLGIVTKRREGAGGRAGRRPTFPPRGTLPDAAGPALSGRHCSPRRSLPRPARGHPRSGALSDRPEQACGSSAGACIGGGHGGPSLLAGRRAVDLPVHERGGRQDAAPLLDCGLSDVRP